jgi:hypothetical protein
MGGRVKAELLDEPELQFGRGCHVDPRFGLLELGPADGDAAAAPRTLATGVIGSQETIEGVVGWLTRCRQPIEGRIEARQSNLFPPFPGFTRDVGFASELVFDARHQRPISVRAFRALASIEDRAERVARAAGLFVEELRDIADRALPQVVLCAPPLELLQVLAGADGATDSESAPQLHDVLKARAMAHPVPLQYVLPATYDESKLRRQNAATGRPRQQQDEATRAWNLHTALYYKAGGYPWALVRETSELQTCFIGISFYWERDGTLATSLAQVFNERGEGVIVRGGPAKLSKTDRQPYLPRDDAERLLREALGQYRREHRHLPARVVVHKTSRFTDGEIAGLEAAADADQIDVIELITVGPSTTRFFTPRQSPPFRGTHVVLDDRTQVLYTTGSIPFYETYPGPYVPQPLGIALDSPEFAPQRHASELLALTKLNWNHSRLDGRDPITTLAARSIGNILRHVPHGASIGNRYAFYM